MTYLHPLEFKECIIDSPSFREKLLLHEQEICNSVKAFKVIYNSIKNAYKTLEDCSIAFKELSENLRLFTSSRHQSPKEQNNTQAETRDEKIIRNAIDMYADLINNIEVMKKEHIFGPSKDIVMNDLQRLKDDYLYRSKQDIKEFKKTTAIYYMKLEKYSATKYKPDIEYDTVDSEFREDRRQYVTKALTYIMNIQETEEQKTCKLVHALSLFIQMLNTYHHQAWDHFGDQKKKVDDVNCALFRTEESYSSILKDTEKLKQQLLSLPIEHIQPDTKVDGETRREGYLFSLTKKAVMSDNWNRKFCVYEKGSKKISLNQVIQLLPNNTYKLQTDEYQLLSCQRKKSSIVDRRFSFDIKVQNLQMPITLQALTKEDLTQWLMIMDGKEPIYCMPQDLGLSQEPETILNEKVLKFLSVCFAEVEKRGIENEGIYRMSGKAAQRDTLLKRIIIEVGNFSSEITSVLDLENIEINTLCSLIKAYIKYLKIPMATYILYDDFIAAGKLQNASEKFNAVLVIIRKLPSDHFQLFSIVMIHLNKITQHHEKNLMTAPNLGVCFSPTIFRPEQGNTSLTAIRESKFAADVISLLIERCNDFFPPVNSQYKIGLSPSKSMYISRKNNDENITPVMNIPKIEGSKPQFNVMYPKLGLKRHDTAISPTTVNQIVAKPPILTPKPNISKLRPKVPPMISVPVSPISEKRFFQPFDGSYPKRLYFKARTLYEFIAENQFQLSFGPNKIITNVRESGEIGWLKGVFEGQTGLFPNDFVQILPF